MDSKKNHNRPQNRGLIRQYKRLLQRWKNQAVEVTIQEVAETLICTPRYARTLLRTMVDLKWLTWSSRPGRGVKGRLHCRVHEQTLYTEQRNDRPVHHDGASNDASVIDDSLRIVVPFYRPVDDIIPSDHTGRVERHLIKMVHAGLTRIDEHGVPQPDLAHTVESENDYLVWRFHLRKGLIWHNGKPALAQQLLNSLKLHLQKPAFQHVSTARLEGKDTIVLKLTRPDALLAHRLANTIHTLPYPGGSETGLGAFQVSRHDHERIILNRNMHYHGLNPQIQEVMYRIEASVSKRTWTTVTVIQPKDDVSDADQTYTSSESSGFVYLAFNGRKKKLTHCQQSLIRALSSIAVHHFDNVEDLQDVITGLAIEDDVTSSTEAKLPPTLSLVYFWAPETEKVMKMLARQMLYWQCRLVLYPLDANHWFSVTDWEQWDIGVSDLRFGIPSWFSPEERFSHSVMIKQFMPRQFGQKLQKIIEGANKNIQTYPRKSQKIMNFLIKKNLIHPLFSFKLKVKTTSNIRGVEVTSQGWPDFTKLWVKK